MLELLELDIPNKTYGNLWLIEFEQITTKPFAWTLIYDTITTNFEGKNTYDLSVPCE